LSIKQDLQTRPSELGITIRTVKEHRARVMEKMEANSLAELVTMIVTTRLKY
jgi:FixJ family two-component response regulator